MFLHLPLSDFPQTISTTLSLSGTNVPVMIETTYNTEGQFWQVTIMRQDGTVVLQNAPVVASVPNPDGIPGAGMLGQFSHLGLGNIYEIKLVDNILNQDPLWNDLSKNFDFVWGDPGNG